ncbi:glycosyltransferase family 2 protein [Bacteroides sp. AF34-31BH]|nr:glycosyltransferase family 2 protein [Bacteroides sp. AF34-31BH]
MFSISLKETSKMMTGIIVVSYHNAEGTRKYVVKQLSKLSDTYRVIVVAVDATEEYGRNLAYDCELLYINQSQQVADHPKGWCISTTENLGYAKGNNWGVNILKKSGISFDNYLFSNDDIEIMNPNILNVLATTFYQDEQCAGVGPRVIGLDGNDQSPHMKYISPKRLIGWKLFPFLRKKRKRETMKNQKATFTISESTQLRRQNTTTKQAMLPTTTPKPPKGKCYWVSGAFMLVRADRFHVVEGFDSRTFLYYEEAILAERFILHGWSFAFEPSVSVIHYEGGSTTVKTDKRNAIETESRILYYKEYRREHSWLLWIYEKISKM